MKNQNNDQYYIIRTDRAGVFYAQIKEEYQDASGVNLDLANARKVHGWDGACAIEELALHGPQVQGGNNRWTVVVPEMRVMNAIQIIPVSDAAKLIIEAQPEWKKAK